METQHMQATWLITGCSSGFGRNLAETALEQGKQVIVTARTPETLEDLVRRFPKTAIAVHLDVTNDTSVAAAVKKCKPLSGCIDCRKCVERGVCVFDDRVNEFLGIAANYDGYVFGSPVHWGAAGGSITSFMDRVVFAYFCGGGRRFQHKPAACVVSARREGTTASLDQMHKYFSLMQMPSSRPVTGMRYTAQIQTKCARTRKECRICGILVGTWRGCSPALMPERELQSLCRSRSQSFLPTSSASCQYSRGRKLTPHRLKSVGC